MTKGALWSVLERAPPSCTWSELTAPKTNNPMMKRKIHTIQERSQKRISNSAIRKNIDRFLIPVPNFGKEHVFQIGLAGQEALPRQLLSKHVQERPSANKAVRDDAEGFFVMRQLRLGDGALPYPAVQFGDRSLRCS